MRLAGREYCLHSQLRCLVAGTKVHFLKFLPRLSDFHCASVALDGNPVAVQHSTVHLTHADSAFLLDMHFLRFRKQGQARKRYICAVTARGYFLLIQPAGRVVVVSPLLPSESSLNSASILPIYTSEGYTKRLFITLESGKVVVFTKAQLLRLYRSMAVESDFTIYSHEGAADVVAWTRLNTVFETREILVVANNARSALTQYALPKPDEEQEIGLSDVLKASFFSVKSRLFRSYGGQGPRARPNTGSFLQISEVTDPKRMFDRIITLGDLIATLDKAGRVWVLDSNTFLVIRMLKGYRGGEIAWHHTGKYTNLVVYLPSRRLLDVWRMRTGLRATRLRLPEEGRLLSFSSRALFVTESGSVYLFDQSEAGIHPSYFFDSSIDALTASARFQRDRDIVSSYTSRRDTSGLAAIAVENLGLLLPLVLGEANRSGEEYLQLVTLAISKTETLLNHPNKIVIFKTIKADFQTSPDLVSVESLLSALHSRKLLCSAYCEITQRLKSSVDSLASTATGSAEVQSFLDIFHLTVSFDDEFVDARGENEADKVTFEHSLYWTTWKHFYHMCSTSASAEDSQNVSLVLVQLLLLDLVCFERALKMVGKTRGAAVEMFLTWVSTCDIKQLALMVGNSAPAQGWVQSLLHDYTPQVRDFVVECSRLPSVYVLLTLCLQVDVGNEEWVERMKELMALNKVAMLFAAKDFCPQLTMKGLAGNYSISRAIAQWELTEGNEPKHVENHIQTKIREILPERLLSQLSPHLYAIHRADLTLTSTTLNASTVISAFNHLSAVQDPLLLSATLYHLYLKHIAESLYSAFEDVPGVSDLPEAATLWLEALQTHFQAEGSFLQINTDMLLMTITGSWLDVKPLLLAFNLEYLLKVLLLSRLAPADTPSVSKLVFDVFSLNDSEVEDLVYLNLPVQAITSDPEKSTKLFTSMVTSHKEHARVLSSLLTTDEESLKIASVKRLLEEGNDVEADMLIEEIHNTLKLGEALYSVARVRVAYIVQTFQCDPKYALLLSNFPRKLMKLLDEDASNIQQTSLLAAKDLLSRAIKYMDANLSANYAAAAELEDAFLCLYRLATEGSS